jgi:hypothetical protein
MVVPVMSADDWVKILGALAAAIVAVTAALGALYGKVRDVERSMARHVDSDANARK